ncbi:acetyltransferase-related protein [Vibrio ichthyoenteri ATCC 700023]|uniref:Acetyltransferase-related protein n=1 Tax=Vibrio ichthyoenteri ATCC 700023 TaxID=870968 RepID=F9RX82_9VIBR|nr:GNAT family N-acetyltransferase [Vibrio ichthyoenteri]EGU48205.1 acetyltransferase-related protein [Vibrio ichthyoenteri ATCC 700023]
MTIVTRRALLVPYNESLQSDFLVLNCCAKNRAYLDGPHTVATAKLLFQNILNDETLYARAVLDSRTRDYMGHIFISHLDSEPELGYIFDKAYWGQGIGYEALKAFFSKAVRDLQLHKIKATSNMAHTASNRLLEKLGFELKGQSNNDFGPYNEYLFTSDEVANETLLHEILA